MPDTPARIEPERYELTAPPAYRFAVDRRDFLGLLGGGLLVVFSAGAQESGRARRSEALPQDLDAWLHIGEDGAVTICTGKTEVGQNIRTSLSQAAAEELHCPIASIKLVMADTALVPYDMGTFGSRTTPTMAPQIRRAAATAREALLDLAAEKWNVDRAKLSIADGKIACAGAAAPIGFGELTKGQKIAKTIAPDAPVARPLCQSVPKLAAREIVTGQHKYTSDLTRPGMLYGRVLRPPAFGATLANLEAPSLPGVTVVHENNFVGVAAPDARTAAASLRQIKAEWNREPVPPGAAFGPGLYEYLKQTSEPGQPDVHGSVADGMAAADIKLAAAYTVAYIAHAPLEPRAALAEWDGGKLTVSTGSQVPFGVRRELASAFGIPEDRVRVIVPDAGAAYGGKHSGECAVEAARLAKAAGKPVKLVWTREEEFTWSYFRPAGLIEISSGVRHDGSIAAWECHNYNSGGSALVGKYDIANQRNVFHPAKSPLRQGSYRALAATANHFAREVHIDELAHALHMDPLEFRLKNLKDERLRAVLHAAAERFRWGTGNSKDKGIGIAGGFEKNGYIATCAQVDIEDSRIRILRVVQAFDCGAVVNPDHLKNQIQGAISMAIGGALFEQIRFGDGQILNPRFSQYRVPRFSDMPEIEVVLVDRPDLPSAGAGETPIVGLAPAVANAVFHLNATRLRSLPLLEGGL